MRHETLDSTRILEEPIWVQSFVDWHNNVHLHSAIHFVTPSDRHSGKDVEVLAHRHKIYQAAKGIHPERWSGKTRNWEHEEQVALKKVFV
ncbi:MAG: hypothetical protein IAE91_02035 [Ignavibacteriaceae bacterium]|nr:hypothetical protein [Ignavibacteriaceae bacterium]